MYMYMYVYTWRSESGRISVGAAQVAANPVLVMSGLPPGLVDNTDMVSAWQACKPKCFFLTPDNDLLWRVVLGIILDSHRNKKNGFVLLCFQC